MQPYPTILRLPITFYSLTLTHQWHLPPWGLGVGTHTYQLVPTSREYPLMHTHNKRIIYNSYYYKQKYFSLKVIKSRSIQKKWFKPNKNRSHLNKSTTHRTAAPLGTNLHFKMFDPFQQHNESQKTGKETYWYSSGFLTHSSTLSRS